jgi:hypothetical protein
VRQERHAACTREKKNFYKTSVGKPEGKNHLKKLGVDGELIFT